MLHYRHRKPQIHVLSLDPILVADIAGRLHDEPQMKGIEVITPHAGHKVTPDQIDRMARSTTASWVLILDVRSDTLPLLQPAYNKVVGYNRADFNFLCYSLCIADGPATLFQYGSGVEVFALHLARFRLDYSPAAFFYDPFLHYAHDERPPRGLDFDAACFDRLPKRLAKQLGDKAGTISEVRRCFRAAEAASDRRAKVRQARLKILTDMLRRRLAEAFPAEKNRLETFLSKEGFPVPGETLPLHLYPLFFEDWVADLAERAAQARLRDR